MGMALSVVPASDTHKRPNKKHDGLICQQCGKEFSGRIDAKYCSGVCRKAAHRRVEQIRDMALTAIGAIRDMKRLSVKYADDARLSSALAMAIEDIRTELSVVPAVVTEKAVSVSIAAETEKQICPKCGRNCDYISIFTDECDACIHERLARKG